MPENKLGTAQLHHVVGHDPELVDRLGGGSGIRVVMEASGGYERVPHHELVDKGVITAIVNPKRVRDFAKAPSGASWRRLLRRSD